MWKRFFGFLSVVAGTSWQWLWEFIRSLFYEHGAHMLTPIVGSITTDALFRWVPTIFFPLIGLWMLWKTRPTNVKDIRSHRFSDLLWYISSLAAGIVLLGGMIVAAYLKIDDRIHDMSTALTRVETKLDDLLQRIPPIPTPVPRK